LNGQGYFFAFSTPEKATGGPGGGKAPSGIGKLSTAEVLRLRATRAVSPDPSVRRSAQDDDFVAGLEYNWTIIGPAFVNIYAEDLGREGDTEYAETTKRSKKSQPLRMTILWEFEEKHPK
jgi:hypothetical protein